MDDGRHWTQSLILLKLPAELKVFFSLLVGRWKVVLGASLTDSNHTTSGTYDNYEYNGKITKVDLQNTIVLNQRHTLVVGFETEKEEYDTSYGDEGDVRKQSRLRSGSDFLSKIFSVALGIRMDNHEEFGTETTWANCSGL